MRISARALALGLFGLGVSTGSAMAADPFVDEPEAIAAAADYDWAGAYVGVFAGYGSGEVSLAAPGTPEDELGLDAAGWLAGLRLGANGRQANLVFGLEGDIAATSIDGTGRLTGGATPVDYSYDLDWLGTLTGRLGVSTDALLVYAKAGLAAGGVRSTLAATPPLGTGSASGTATGWTLGLGTEFAFTENASAGIEYDFVSLGIDFDYGAGDPLKAQQDLHIVRLGVNYGF